MRFEFNERKAAQAAAHLLQLNSGSMNYMMLIKLLYLADRRSLQEIGQPITGDEMVSMPLGPVLSGVLDAINNGKAGLPSGAWYDYITEPERYDVSLSRQNPDLDELSRYELRLLTETFETYGRWDRFTLKDYLHEVLPEWCDPGRSSMRITPEDILRAVGKSEAEIARVAADAEEMRFFAWLQKSA